MCEMDSVVVADSVLCCSSTLNLTELISKLTQWKFSIFVKNDQHFFVNFSCNVVSKSWENNLQFSITNRLSLIPLRPEEISFIFAFHNCILINKFSSVVCLHNLKMFIQFCFSIFSFSAMKTQTLRSSEWCVNSTKKKRCVEKQIKIIFLLLLLCFITLVVFAEFSYLSCASHVQVHSHLIIYFCCCSIRAQNDFACCITIFVLLYNRSLVLNRCVNLIVVFLR